MTKEEDSWIFESLVSFLQGPVWNVPILTFVENKSMIFEPDLRDNEETTGIHEEYKNLVDFMLGSYMEDISITPEQFEEACGKDTVDLKNKVHQALFEQVWAADNYQIFKRMMIQKNLDLQLQALDVLQKKYGIVPESFVQSETEDENEQLLMSEIIKKSLEEHKAYQELVDQETREYERAIALSHEEREKLEREKMREKELMQEALTKLPEEWAASSTSSATVEQKAQVVNPEDLAKRQAYLREQRDKLLELKRKEREKQLAAYEKTAPQKRPKSSRAARKIMMGDSIDAHTLQVRKALAEKLKAEVIDK